jgi:hypothetical protein
MKMNIHEKEKLILEELIHQNMKIQEKRAVISSAHSLLIHSI